ncbi:MULTISPECIES: DsbA family oxidoreductase [unclassified Dysgonomonas]|uniref:DsbA family oxidoreductase n=1 Tax=unclassified Dysgonomonas TaxID=2630389 RepID=UPI00067FFD37|nr:MULTISPECIES: DsbA family oxidoreductase [unclassified Dysgonomonas]MBD8347096.1 DsbA family oxidoreductase [Dysgonomonas sp. HGC4]MBF0574849.1 DsbA family oxidoreductase [Dysgonomonas sp. GY617]
MGKMKVEIWSDIACPYCYIGKRKFENALAKFPHANEIELVWHSYELNPDLPKRPLGQSYYEYFAGLHGSSIEEVKADLQGLVDLAKEVGLDYHFEKLVVANTSDALRLVKLAKKHKLADETEEVLFKAYFVDGEDISDRVTLVRLGTGVGIPEDEIMTLLNGDEFVVDIEADIRFSEDELNLEYIPFYLFNGKDIIQGSLAEEEYLDVLHNSYNFWKENGVSKGGGGERHKGRACSPDGTCSI